MRKSSKSQPSATLGFEDKIWKACDALRGHIPAADYRKIIVGLIFIRYVSDAFMKQHEKLVAEGEGFENDRDAYTADNIFFVPEDARWDVISAAAHKPEIGQVLDDAMRAVEKGVAYAALRDEESDCDLFVGHPISCDNRDIVLSLTRPQPSTSTWVLEVHNPTAKPIKAKLASDSRFKAFKFAKDIEVPAGASVDVKL